MATKSIVLGGGCFWCLDAFFKRVQGVTDIIVGYTGGHSDHPTYAQVCSGSTGHAEVAKINYDPGIISLEDILRLFFELHDPTTLNRQGNDVGTQYRSVIFYANEEEKNTVERVIAEIQKNFKNPIVTQILPLPEFYEAEEYHQDFYAKNPNQPYCVAVIQPKLEKLLKK